MNSRLTERDRLETDVIRAQLRVDDWRETRPWVVAHLKQELAAAKAALADYEACQAVGVPPAPAVDPIDAQIAHLLRLRDAAVSPGAERGTERRINDILRQAGRAPMFAEAPSDPRMVPQFSHVRPNATGQLVPRAVGTETELVSDPIQRDLAARRARRAAMAAVHETAGRFFAAPSENAPIPIASPTGRVV